MPEAQAVNRFFSSIANRYDLANRVMSGGMDILWRRRLARMVASGGPHDILDLATGSGDVAFTLARRVPTAKTIQGMDFCVPMLDEARSKLEKTGIHQVQISFEQADCHQLPLPDASVDAITIAFGLRNLEDRAQGLRE
ncbi:MAG: class I SAM-dependent methyltransferase, partial [Opitutales bacterium]|nr:class I SAM-dependent methyltransferase [Opitutales bacterium]